MAVTKRMEVARYLGLNYEPRHLGIEGATQSFKEGSLLIYSSGKLVIAVDAADQDPIVGMACHPASGVTDTQVLYVPCLSSVVFEITLAGSAEADHTLVQTNIGVAYAIDLSATGQWYADVSDTTNPEIVVVGHKDPIGTVNARVYVVFKQAETVWN